MKICQPCLFGDHEQIGHESDCSCPCHGQQATSEPTYKHWWVQILFEEPIVERNQYEIHLVKQHSTVTPIEFTSWC